MNKAIFAFVVSTILFSSGCASRPFTEKKAELILFYWDDVAGGMPMERYETKFKAYIDGELVGESNAADRYEQKTLRIEIEPGTHVVAMQGFAMRDGVWEKRVKGQDSRLDHRLEKKVTLAEGGKETISFVVPEIASKMEIRF